MNVGRRRAPLLAVMLALVLAVSGAAAGPVSAGPGAGSSPRPWLELAAGMMAAFPMLGDLAQGMVGPSAVQYGSDGRLTILVLGSDYRYLKPGNGERLDTVIVATINPKTRQMAALSIPRDTGNLPLPDPNDTFRGKVNALFSHYRRIVGNRDEALEKMRETIAYVLRIEIDYVAYARFEGFDMLVDQVDGVLVNIPAEMRDSRMLDDRTRPKGARFLAGTNVRMGGATETKCYAMEKPIDWTKVPGCKRAFLFVRSRHGTIGTKYNSDYKRGRRQQDFLMASLRRVVSRGSGASLTALRDAAQSQPADFYTTLPIASDADLLALFNLFNGAQNPPFLQVVLKPKKYAFHVTGTRKYELKLDVVRALTAQWFAKVN